MGTIAVNVNSHINITIPAAQSLTYGSKREMGFLLAKDQQGRFLYHRGVESTGMPGEREATVIKEDWSGGLGAYMHDSQRPNRYGMAVSVDCSVPGKVMLGPKRYQVEEKAGSAAFADVVEANAEFSIGGTAYLFIGSGRYFYRLDTWSTTPVFTQVDDIGVASESKSFTVFQERLLAAIEGTNNYRYTADGTTWAANGGAGNARYANRFAVVNNVLHKMRGQELASCFSAADAQAGTWTVQATIGDVCYLHEILGMDGSIVVAQEDGIYSIDAFKGWPEDLWPELKAIRHVDNGQRSRVWDNMLWYPTVGAKLFAIGPGGRLFMEPQLQQERELELSNTNYSNLAGPVRALGISDRALFASVQRISPSNSNHRMLKLVKDSQNRYVWHNVAELEYAQQGNVWVTSGSTGGGPVVWSAQGVAYNYHPAYWILPKGNDPLQDDRCRFEANGTLYEPWYDMGYPSYKKHWTFIDLWCVKPATATITLKAVDEYGNIGINSVALTDGWNRVAFAAGFVGRWVRFEYAFTTSAAASTPQLQKYQIHAQVLFPVRYLVDATLDLQEAANKGRDSLKEVINFLRDLNIVERPVTLTDYHGIDYSVMPVVSGIEEIGPSYDNMNWKTQVRVRLREEETV